jgi:hypothetical protein
MDSFFYYFGVISFLTLIGFIGFVLYSNFSEDIYDLKRRYHDYCWFSNMGWNQKDFDTFMENEREKMSKEEYEVWAKKNVRFWYSWICFKPMKK